MIEGGTLFFVAASFYYLIRSLESDGAGDLIKGIVFCTFGCLYKHPMVSVIPAFALMTVYDFFFPKGAKPIRPFWAPVKGLIIPAVTVLVYMKLSSFNSDVPSDLFFPTFERMAANLRAVALGVTLPIALSFLGGMIYLAFWRWDRLFWFLLSWIGTHFILSCMSDVYANVRQSLPYYVGAIVAASIFIDAMADMCGNRKKLILYGILPVWLLWACLLMNRVQDIHLIGRAMGDRSYVNLTNWKDSYIPYDAIIQDLKETTAPGDTIYAPMANEPVKFYIEKYDFHDRRYIRDEWGPINHSTPGLLIEFCLRNEVDWLLLPRGKWLINYGNLRIG